jgi:prefoldin subunit 5
MDKFPLGDDLDAFQAQINKFNGVLDSFNKRLGDLDKTLQALSGAKSTLTRAASPSRVEAPMPRSLDQAIPYLKRKCEAILAAH